MDIEKIRQTIEKVNSRYLDLQVEGYTPNIIIEEGDYQFPNKRGILTPFSEWWPDVGDYRDSIFIANRIAPMGHNKDMKIDSSYVEFVYRTNVPASNTSWFALRTADRGIGKRDRIVSLMDTLMEELGCEERVYISHVVNPKFWTEEGYFPFVKKDSDIYWAKMTSKAKGKQLSLGFGNKDFRI